MEIVIDTREQQPYSEDYFSKGSPLKVSCSFIALPVGDYSLKGKEKEIAIERKTLNDFIHSITTDRERFERELEKSKGYKRFAIIVEGDFNQIKSQDYYSNASPRSILGTSFKWIVKYNIPIIFVSTREGGALAVYKMLEAVEQYGI